MKTVREWLESLPEPYRGQALENMTVDGVIKEDTLYNALAEAFTWIDTPQGDAYWRTLAEGDALPYAGQTEAPTNAISALHAIALKKGFPVEEIRSVQPAKESGCWIYTLVDDSPGEYFINLKTDK